MHSAVATTVAVASVVVRIRQREKITKQKNTMFFPKKKNSPFYFLTNKNSPATIFHPWLHPSLQGLLFIINDQWCMGAFWFADLKVAGRMEDNGAPACRPPADAPLVNDDSLSGCIWMKRRHPFVLSPTVSFVFPSYPGATSPAGARLCTTFSPQSATCFWFFYFSSAVMSWEMCRLKTSAAKKKTWIKK